MAVLDIPADVRDRARRVRVLGLDIDGVMTDGGLYFGADGEHHKRFNVQDGFGLKLLMAAGITIVVITGRSSTIVARRAADLGITDVFQGVPDKRACLGAFLAGKGLSWREAAYMGDDWPDLGVLRQAGLALAPANADAAVLAHVHWRSPRGGGQGAVRDAAELLLRAQDRYDALLAEHL